MYIALSLELHDDWDEDDFINRFIRRVTIPAPEGCVGVLLVFESLEAAEKAYSNSDIEFIPIAKHEKS
jgi:hypothetical protein